MPRPVIDRHIWLASYPKSGNTWMRLALDSLLGDPVGRTVNDRVIGAIASDRGVFDGMLDIDSSDLSADEILQLRPALYRQFVQVDHLADAWKVHDAWGRTSDGQSLFPADVTQGTVYLIRDPRDVAPSLAHHLGVGVDQAITVMADRDYCLAAGGKRLSHQLRQRLFSWSQHVESWLDQSDLSPLLIRYEDMIQDLAVQLHRLCTYLNWPVDQAAIARAVTQTRFDTLRQRDLDGGFGERPAPDREFFRRGVAGGWRDSLTADQVRRIELDHGPLMRRFGYL